MYQLQVDGVLVVGKLLWSIERADNGVGRPAGDDGGQGEDIIVVVLGAALVNQGYDGEVLGVGARETRVPAGVRGEGALLGDRLRWRFLLLWAQVAGVYHLQVIVRDRGQLQGVGEEGADDGSSGGGSGTKGGGP